MSKSSTMEPELLTIDQAAAFLRVSRKTLVRWRDRGAVPYVSLPNGMTRFKRQELADWIEARTRRPRP